MPAHALKYLPTICALTSDASDCSSKNSLAILITEIYWPFKTLKMNALYLREDRRKKELQQKI